MVFSPDGTKIASTHGDHKIYVTDIKSAKCLHTLEGHPRTPWCIAFHPTSNDILASGCLGGEVRIWDLHGGSEVWVTQHSSVIASLAFHPFGQVLVIATLNELFFWDWSKSQPFARCKTATDREKVRYVKFDPMGNKLITGIANLPIIQSSRHESTRTLANRYVSLRERYNRILEVRREGQRFHSPAAHNTVGTDPVATNERPTSPTQAEALFSARDYARQVTAAVNRPLVPRATEGTSSSYSEYLDRDGWRYRDPFSLQSNRASSSLTSSSSSPSSLFSLQQEFFSTLNSRLRANSLFTSSARSEASQPSEMSLPSSLIQALVRLQRSLELLEPRMNSIADRRNAEQAHLRQRIEEILNRLFNLYASITPLRILMDEVFQDFDREIVLAEVNREANSSGSSSSGIASQLQELRQQLARLLDRIFSTEMDLQSNQSTNNNSPSRRNVPTSTSCVQNSRSTSTVTSESSSPLTSQGIRTEASSSSTSLGGTGSTCPSAPGKPEAPTSTAARALGQFDAASTSDQRSARFFPINVGGLDRYEQNYEEFVSTGDALTAERPSAETTVDPPPNRPIPRVQIDPPEPRAEDDDDAQEDRPALRPRSPPLDSILHSDRPAQQQYVDYHAASTSGSGRNGRPRSGSLFLHPNYVASLFEESLQRTSALQLVINRAIAGNSDFAVVNNVMSLTHRIQCWDFSKLEIPSISDAQANMVVSECKIHNDASVDISTDGHLLATLVPGSVGLPSTTVVGIYSLEKRTFGSCLYSFYFGPNAISVSLSPLSRYIVVGLASRRATMPPNEKQVVAQIFKLLLPKIDGQENLELIRNIEQRGTSRVHVSLNSIRWLPHPGEGVVYGTNRGELRLCRPGPSKEDEYVRLKGKARLKGRNFFCNLNLPGANGVQSASTQTIAPQTQSAGTQTGFDFDVMDEVSFPNLSFRS